MIYVTAIKLAGGTGHEHITHFRWLSPTKGTAATTDLAAMVTFVEQNKGETKVAGEGGPSTVGVVESGSRKWLRTFADGDWNNNLLELPRLQ